MAEEGAALGDHDEGLDYVVTFNPVAAIEKVLRMTTLALCSRLCAPCLAHNEFEITCQKTRMHS